MKSKVLVIFLALTIFSGQIFALPNFHQVNPSIFRGARPEEKDFYLLVQAGIKTVLSLETKLSTEERALAEKHGLIYIWIPLHPLFTPEKKTVDEIIAILRNPVYQPVFIHCRKGKDRTGLVIAAYRITVDGWTFEDAYQEMKKYGFSRYLFWWKNFLLNYLKEKK
ncbi:MAG TPA: protein-tyrosine-phosphatase [Elusimicrobia bacterium]|jgi:protein tyrosine/serine phosphatase|nr:protein-tyrosine-phosphatase [Elusimicrobiota bacterium]